MVIKTNFTYKSKYITSFNCVKQLTNIKKIILCERQSDTTRKSMQCY